MEKIKSHLENQNLNETQVRNIIAEISKLDLTNFNQNTMNKLMKLLKIHPTKLKELLTPDKPTCEIKRSTRVGRNSSCECGSGKKSKKCCFTF
jgi:uncharacterized protein YecA (UPF0149 family)